MINLITAPPGVGKTLFAVMQLDKHQKDNAKNLPLAKEYYLANQDYLSNNADKKIVVDLAEFKGNQNLFKEIRLALEKYDAQEITLLEYFSCFNHYDFSEFYSDKVTPDHYYLSTSYNLIANFANKQLNAKFKMIPPVRQIYSDINGLRVDDVLESPDDWRSCPDGSIIFYDEVQNRAIYKNTRDKNEIVSDLTIHRHRGFDIYFITQFPVLIHTEVRAVVGQHYHLFRPWGLPQAYVHVWSYAVVDPNSFSKKRAAERTFRFSYDKKIYKLYTSSTMHTHKINLPKKLILYGAGISLGLFLMYDGISGGTIFNKGTDNQESVMDKVNNAKNSNPYAAASTNPNFDANIECRKGENVEKPECIAWFNGLSENKASVSSTGNISVSYNPNEPYNTEEIAKTVTYEVTSKPKFSGCAKFGKRYQAYTEQGTKLNVSESDCKRIIDDNDRPYDFFSVPASNNNNSVHVSNNSGSNNIEEYSNTTRQSVSYANNYVEPHLQQNSQVNGANAL